VGSARVRLSTCGGDARVARYRGPRVCGYLVSGRIGVRMDDGSTMEFGPGDVYEIPPSHDGWVIGDEPAVGIEVSGSEIFARPR
jgi:hypothetical protein